MAFECQFRQASGPSLVESFSSRDTPCRYETPSGQSGTRPQGPCPYRDYCRETTPLLAVITSPRVFGPYVRVSLAEVSTNIVARSEHQFNREIGSRFSLRKHLYDARTAVRSERFTDAKGLPGSRGILDCDAIESDDASVRYLGFVESRLSSSFLPSAGGSTKGRSLISLAILAVPHFWEGRQESRFVTGAYGPIFGGPSFPATVYGMQDSQSGGALCAQMCLVMALGMLTDRGGNVCGSHTLSFDVLKKEPVETWVRTLTADEGKCLGRSVSVPEGRYYRIDGFTPGQCVAALEKRNVSPDWVYFWNSERSSTATVPRLLDRLIVRVIQAYVDARCPLILFVDSEPWAPNEPFVTGENNGHTVVAVGYARTGPGPDDWEIVTHDPARRPYLARRASFVLASMWEYGCKSTSPEAKSGEKEPHACLIPVADSGLHVHAQECLNYLLDRDPEFPNRGPAAGPYQSKHVDRFRKYVDPSFAGRTDFRIRLSRPDEIDRELAYLAAPPHAPKLEPTFHQYLSPVRRYWFVMGFVGGQLNDLWAFDSTGFSTPPMALPDFATFRSDGGWVVPDHPPEAESRDLPRTRPAVTPARPGNVSDSPPAPAPAGDQLRVSVITSSSGRTLPNLLEELANVGNAPAIDLLLLRQEDIYNQLGTALIAPSEQGRVWENDSVRILSKSENMDVVANWVRNAQIQSGTVGTTSVAAFATYFPEITGPDKAQRDLAIAALANSIKVGYRLWEYGLLPPNGPVVLEAVCGTRFSVCQCRACQRTEHGVCFIPPEADQLRLLMSGLDAVLADVDEWLATNPVPTTGRPAYAIALELEPGETYLLNSMDMIRRIGKEIREPEHSRRHGKIGFNLDIAHMIIANVRPEELVEVQDLIVHAHIADHPRLHTRDQPVGTWTPPYQSDTAYLPYVRLLTERLRTRSDSVTPFSGFLALELEGSNCIDSIYRSVPAKRHLARRASF